MKGLGALIGLKIVCCGGLLLVASGTLAAAQLGLGAAAVVALAGAGWLVQRTVRCARESGGRRLGEAELGPESIEHRLVGRSAVRA